MPRWGIDLGGTKIEGVVLADSGEPLCRLRIPTLQERGYDHILLQIARLLTDLSAETGLAAPETVGIGIPGIFDPQTRLVASSNTLCLTGRSFADDLQAATGLRFAIANDANCFALAEARLGAARGASVVFAVILGTGVGGATVVEGRLLTGRSGTAGEWGHNVLEPGGIPCYCGNRGCVETVLAGPWLERWHRDRGGEPVALPEIAERALNGDAIARETIDRLTSKFGEAISTVVNVLDPDVIVLGGGVGNVAALYTDGLESLRRWAFTNALKTRLVKPTLGDSAGVFGAAMLTT